MDINIIPLTSRALLISDDISIRTINKFSNTFWLVFNFIFFERSGDDLDHDDADDMIVCGLWMYIKIISNT